jgi:holliday junction DNA helicase RuvA
MIGRLKGRLLRSKPNEVTVDVHGIGFLVSIPFSTYSSIAHLEEADLFIHTHVREDQIRLFGFSSEQEKDLFEILLHISGIGPSIALSILSGIDAERLYDAVFSGNSASLVKIPGIGKSKAEKLIFELKRIFEKRGISERPRSAGTITIDAIEALITLGFNETLASRAVEKVYRENPDTPLEILVKKALGILSE